jgi:hypothetical protein
LRFRVTEEEANYIPFTEVEGWDGNIGWLRVSRQALEREYAMHSAPDPTEYYVKSRPGIHFLALIHE